MTGLDLDQLDETEGIPVLDLFAGHGWGVACQALGLREYGVELMPEARAVREANGMTTLFADVWDGLENAYDDFPVPDYALLIASPPCQTFSMAGSGAGRKALDEVLGLIDDRAYLDVAKLRAFGDSHDPRTALVLTPLSYIARDAPLYVVLEQVPPVLPVWERYAVELERWGYSVWTGIVNAEQYGVPQTRKRAILIARADGVEAAPPKATHSRYYPRDPKRMDEGVEPWVSMAEALGWGMTERPFVTAGNAVGRAEGIGGTGGKAAIVGAKERGAWKRPAPTVTSGGTGSGGGVEVFAGKEAREAWRKMRSNYGTSGIPGDRGERGADSPAPTMTSKAGRNHWVVTGGATTERYEPRSIDAPAPPITGASNTYVGQGEPFVRHEDGSKTKSSSAEKITVAEAAALQSYPPGFVWDVEVETTDQRGRTKVGPVTKTKTFLQIGNAVPPRLALAVLSSLGLGGER